MFKSVLEANLVRKIELLSRIGVALVATTLVGASVFAESRPSNETRGHRGERGRIERRSSGGDNSSNDSRQRSRRSEEGDRSYRNRDRSTERPDRSTHDRSNNDRYHNDRYNNNDRHHNDHSNREWRDRNDNRSDRYRSDRSRSDRSRSYGSYGRSGGYRQPYYSHGRISRVHRYGGGYRVWIVGAQYPYYIPLAYYRHDRFRVGLSINLGGYYNSGGYYDYYDGYDSRSDGAIRGVVESVDYRRDSFVVRNDATGSFVTVLSRDRRLDVRAGDYVELAGEWTRSGVFTAWDVNFLEDEYRR